MSGSSNVTKNIIKKHYTQLDHLNKIVGIEKKLLSIALYENFPFGKELKSELEKILSLDNAKNYFKDQILIINYKEYFYNEFYSFLFDTITDFDELNIGTKKDEIQKAKYFSYTLTGNDFETKLKATINYSKYVTKRFFQIFPYIRTQFKKTPSKVINTKTNKIIAQNSDNRLIDWYSREKFQRLMMLIDIREKEITLKRKTSKDIQLYIKIIRRMIEREYLGIKESNSRIITEITYDLPFTKEQEIKFSNKFYSWLKSEDGKKIIEKEKFKFFNSHFYPRLLII